MTEFLEFKKSQEFLNAALKNSSIRKLSRKLGYASDRGIGMVAKGQRPMSVEMQERLGKFLKLTSKEQLHLQKLVRVEKSPLAVEPEPKKPTNTLVSNESLHPLIPAYSLVILEILRTSPTELSVQELSEVLLQKVSDQELQLSLNSLANAGLIKSEGRDFFRSLRPDEYVESSQDVPSKTIREIHRAQLKRAAETLDEQSVLDREFIAKTLTVPKSKLPQFKRLLREKIEELASEIGQESADADSVVAQLNLQFYLQSTSSFRRGR